MLWSPSERILGNGSRFQRPTLHTVWETRIPHCKRRIHEVFLLLKLCKHFYTPRSKTSVQLSKRNLYTFWREIFSPNFFIGLKSHYFTLLSSPEFKTNPPGKLHQSLISRSRPRYQQDAEIISKPHSNGETLAGEWENKGDRKEEKEKNRKKIKSFLSRSKFRSFSISGHLLFKTKIPTLRL